MLTSTKNPLIKEIRQLHQSKFRRQNNRLILEGTNLIAAAIEANYPLDVCCYTEEWQAKYPQLEKKVIQLSQRVSLVNPLVLKAIATTVNPDGVVATATRMAAKTPNSQINLGLMCDRLQDPGNLGTIIRTAVGVGVDALWLSRDCVDFDHPKLLRASAGAWFNLPIATTESLSSQILDYQSQNIQVIATLAQAEQTYWDLDLTKPTVILLGNEGAGLSPDLIALADQRVKIPITESVESLNVAIATSLLLYEALRQRLYQNL